MSGPELCEATILLSEDAAARWYARRVAHAEEELTVSDVLARMRLLETDISPDAFELSNEGGAIRARLVVGSGLPWVRSLEAIVRAAALQGGAAELVTADALPEMSYALFRVAFAEQTRTEIDVPDDGDAFRRSFEPMLGGVEEKRSRARPPAMVDAERTFARTGSLDAAATLALGHPFEHVRRKALDALGRSRDEEATSTLFRALVQTPGDVPPWPLSAFGGTSALRARDRELMALRGSAAHAIAAMKPPAPGVRVRLRALVDDHAPALERSAGDGRDPAIDRLAAIVRLLGDLGVREREDALAAMWRSHPSRVLRCAAARALFALGTWSALEALASWPGGPSEDYECARAFLRLDRATAFDRAASFFRAESVGGDDAFAILHALQTEDFRGAYADPSPRARILDDARWQPLLTTVASHPRAGHLATALLRQLDAHPRQ